VRSMSTVDATLHETRKGTPTLVSLWCLPGPKTTAMARSSADYTMPARIMERIGSRRWNERAREPVSQL
jgi:hypothetical protein